MAHTAAYKPQPKWTIYHVNVFVMTFVGWALIHASRKTFSNVKQTMAEEWSPSCESTLSADCHTKPDEIWNRRRLFDQQHEVTSFMGTLDFVFLIPYGVGLYVSGILGDRFDLRILITVGMCSTSIFVLLFGTVTEWLQFYNKPFYAVIWALHGFCQAVSYPATVVALSNWFGRSRRGVVLGLWSACNSGGNVAGSLMAGAVVNMGYEIVFLVTSSITLAVGVITFFGLVAHPHEVGYALPDESIGEVTMTVKDKHDDHHAIEDSELQELNTGSEILNANADEDDIHIKTNEDSGGDHDIQGSINFFRAMLLPGVVLYALAYACLKLVNYGFFFWLPLYLHLNYGWSQKDADEVSIWYDVGGILGGSIAGFVSDRIGMYSPVVCISLALAAPSLYFYRQSPNDKLINAVLMTFTGVFIAGPANLISSAISADLGRRNSILVNKHALATVTGIIDGTGTAGAAIGQKLIPVLEYYLGWQWVFYSFIILVLLTLVCVLPILVQDMKTIKCIANRFQSQRNGQCAETHMKKGTWKAGLTSGSSGVEEHTQLKAVIVKIPEKNS